MTTEEVSFFDNLSESWDANETQSTPDKINEILSYIGIKEGMSILDLGTGTGVLIPFLASDVGNKGKITAVDLSEGMLSKAKEKYGTLKNVTFLKKDFEEEMIPGEFDRIILYCVYPHFHKPYSTLRKLIDNNLKEEGQIIIAFPTDEKFINNIHKERKAESDMLKDAPQLADELKGQGFKALSLAYSSDRYIVGITKSTYRRDR